MEYGIWPTFWMRNGISHKMFIHSSPPGAHLPPPETKPSDPPLPPRAGMDNTPNQLLTGTYYVEFKAGQLLVVSRPRIWDTHGHA